MRHFEAFVLVSNTVGEVEARVNGQIILDLTGFDTQSQATDDITQIRVSDGITSNSNIHGNNEMWIDDAIIWDTTGTEYNTFLGDCRAFWMPANAVGASSQFTPTSGANYTNVDDATPDDDTTTVADTVVGHIDSYGAADLPGSAIVVLAVAHMVYAKKDDAGARAIAAKIRLAGTYATGADIALSNAYLFYQTIFQRDPANAPWTPTNVNAMEVGAEIRS
jgi:hypothetical protein